MLLNAENKRIRIYSKKLSSGNCQVKFFLNCPGEKPYYGYMLVAPGRKVSEVITTIYQKLQDMDLSMGQVYQKNSWINRKRHVEPDFMLFEGIPAPAKISHGLL